MLGLISKISLNKIHIDKLSCVNCSKCSLICPSGCIDYKNGKINNETCIKCLKCLDVCPKGAIKYDTQKNNETKFSPKRRDLIILGAVSAVFLATIKTTLILKDKAIKKFREIILPPGAISDEQFSNKCINCNLCVENCPNKIIKKANNEFETVHLNLDNGFGAGYNANQINRLIAKGNRIK